MKPFPMQGGPSIPWETAEIVYRAYSAIYGTSQTLQRLGERGGFGWGEVEHIFKEFRRSKGETAFRKLLGEKAAWERPE